MSIANYIKQARETAGITQKELAKRINKSFSVVQKYELGITQPPIDVIKDIAVALNVDPYSLITFDMATNKENDELRRYRELKMIESIKSKQEFFETEKRNEKKFFEDYRCLNHTGKAKAHSYVADLAEQSKYTEPELSDEKMEKIPPQKEE